MNVSEITAKTILRKQNRTDTWFCSRYGMNLYRGCVHNCAYCDGRDEKYRVAGTFESDIEVKVNAAELLEKELDPSRKRKPFEHGFFVLGGGVADAFQPAEKKYRLARQTLELLLRFGHPLFLLTKGIPEGPDIELIEQINNTSGAVVCVSISSADDCVSRTFEPGAPPPSERLDFIRRCAEKSIPCGVCLLPVIPSVTDSPALLHDSFRAAREAGAAFVLFGGMTLKQGRQKEHFYRVLGGYRRDLLHHYDILYSAGYGYNNYGNPSSEYFLSLNSIGKETARALDMPMRMPVSLYGRFFTINERVSLMLRQIHELLTGSGFKSTYGYAAHSLDSLQEPLTSLPFQGARSIRSLSGIGPSTVKLIREIVETGTSRFYEKIIRGGIPAL